MSDEYNLDTEIGHLLGQLDNLVAQAQNSIGLEDSKRIELELTTLKTKRELVQINWERLKTIAESKLTLACQAIGFAKITINTLVIVNAGAVLALLAFLGNVVKGGCEIVNINFLSYYIAATVLAISTSALAYLSQISFIDLPEKYANKVGNIFRALGILAALASLSYFIFGSTSALQNFGEKDKVVKCTQEQSQSSKTQHLK